MSAPPPDVASNVTALVDASSEVSERSVAQLWASINEGSWVFDHTRQLWFRYSGCHWEEDAVRLAFHSIGALASKCGKGSKAVAKRSFVLGVEAFAQADPRLAANHSKFDVDPFLTGTPGKTIDCRTGGLIEPDPAHFISKRTSVEPADGEPELWLKCLHDWTKNDPQTVRFLQQFCGYCLTGSTAENMLVNAIGGGKNGKTTFLNTVRKVLGDYACTASMAAFTASRNDSHPTDLAMLVGARLVTASETEEGRAWAEAKIKQITGGDPITARFMRQDFFTYQPQFKLLIVSNHLPQLHNVDEATRRRFNIVPFDYVPTSPDPELEMKLEAEHGKILTWMIEGCLDWQRSGGLIRPDAVKRATEDYFEAQDLLGQWIIDSCETGHNLRELPEPLYRSWSAYARANGEDPGTSKSFFQTLQKRGFGKVRTGGMRFRSGIQLRRDTCDG